MPGEAHALFPASMLEQARNIVNTCRRKGLTLATAESCTGGLVSAILTEIPGSSDVFTHGFITYANRAKIEMIQVSSATLASQGAVSETIARAMAEGALRTAAASLSVAITGIAGPGGGSEAKPVGTVHIASARQGGATLHGKHQFDGDRTAIRLQAVEAALALVLKQLELS